MEEAPAGAGAAGSRVARSYASVRGIGTWVRKGVGA
jgi:hypothetical protein